MVKHVSVWQPAPGETAEDERPALSEERLSAAEASKIGAYLESGAVVMHTTVRGIDILGDDEPVVPMTIRTDGVYVWVGPVTYYVQTRRVAPDAEFLRYVRARDYEVRVPDEAEIQDALDAFTL